MSHSSPVLVGLLVSELAVGPLTHGEVVIGILHGNQPLKPFSSTVYLFTRAAFCLFPVGCSFVVEKLPYHFD